MANLRVLTIANYISDDETVAFSHNLTGYGYIVNDITNGISQSTDVKLFNYSGFTPEHTYQNIKVLCNQPRKLLYKGFSFGEFFSACAYVFSTRAFFKEALRVAYAILVRRSLKANIDNSDIVHVHGCTPNLMPFVRYVLDLGKPVLVTLHGLNSFSGQNKASLLVKQNEREFLQWFLSHRNGFLSVLTPRAKNLIAEYVKKIDTSKIRVIPNPLKPAKNIRLESKSKSDFKTILYVGNLSEQKNQKALLNTIIAHEDSLKDCEFYFIGEICGDFDYYVDYFSSHDSRVTFTGHIPRDKLQELYCRADVTVLLSKDEGFGMSILEGFQNGLQAVISANIEISSTLEGLPYVHLVNEPSDSKSVLDALLKALNTEVDEFKIREFSTHFNLNFVCNAYFEYYKDVSSKG